MIFLVKVQISYLYIFFLEITNAFHIRLSLKCGLVLLKVHTVKNNGNENNKKCCE